MNMTDYQNHYNYIYNYLTRAIPYFQNLFKLDIWEIHWKLENIEDNPEAKSWVNATLNAIAIVLTLLEKKLFMIY